MSRRPQRTAPFMIHILAFEYSRSWQFGQVVSRLLIGLLGVLDDVGLVDLLRPVPRLDFFHRNRNRLLPIAQDAHHVPRDGFGQPGLLLFGFPGPELHDHVRQCSLLPSVAAIVAGVTCGTARRSPSPSSPPPCRRVSPGWRCASSRSSASPRASASSPADTGSHRRGGSPRSDRPTPAPSHSPSLRSRSGRADAYARRSGNPARR